jgi:hypothetical protein
LDPLGPTGIAMSPTDVLRGTNWRPFGLNEPYHELYAQLVQPRNPHERLKKRELTYRLLTYN